MRGIWKYNELLPEVAVADQITLGEGNTPLVRSRRIGPDLGLSNLFFKLENLNPSGSYKDRFAAMAVSGLMQQKAKFCLATSSGNTGAALAAYCAVANIPCLLAIVEGAPEGKLLQMQVYGAGTLMISHFGKDPAVNTSVMATLDKLAREGGGTVQISAFCYSPFGMAGVQTLAYEIAEALPEQRINVFVPAGGGGLTLAVAKGFERWNNSGLIPAPAAVHCVQPEGNDTIASALRNGGSKADGVFASTTGISGLQVPNVLDGNEVITICRDSGGQGYTVPDTDILSCQHQMAREEGIYCEPAGAVALAGIKKAIKLNELLPDQPVICVVTGHGFKDPVSTAGMAESSLNVLLDQVDDLKNYVAITN